VRLFLDDKMIIVKQRFQAPGPRGGTLSQEEAFSDYRTVAGVRVPFQATVSQDGRAIAKRTLTKVAINGPLDPAIFEYPGETRK
jgi:hypothetical protein